MIMKNFKFKSYDHTLNTSSDAFGYMRNSFDATNDVEELRRRFDADGYLYIKNYLNKDLVLKCREQITDVLMDLDLLDKNWPAIFGVSKKDAGYVFKPEVVEKCPAIKELLYSGKMIDFYKKFYGEDIRHYDYTWLRAIGPGKGTNPHCDLPYMGRGTHKHMTAWVPYGEIDYKLGGLMVLENSFNRMDLLEKYVYRDVDEYCENRSRDVEKVKEGKWVFSGSLSHNPVAIQKKFTGRWLVAEYEPGDFLTFGMFMVHASLDNQTDNRFRISSDSRYQRISEPVDERWIGLVPPGHGDKGKRGLIC